MARTLGASRATRRVPSASYPLPFASACDRLDVTYLLRALTAPARPFWQGIKTYVVELCIKMSQDEASLVQQVTGAQPAPLAVLRYEMYGL